MRRAISIARMTLTVFALLLAASRAIAQDLVITNARIVDGKGGVIERGHVVVSGGTIASVAAGAPSSRGPQTIDAQGRTLMPGFIDAHRHIAQGDSKEWLSQRAAP